MAKNSIRSIRREELSRAAFEAVARYGLRKATLEKVGEIAGVSKGVVLHHFKDKSSLLEAVFRKSNSLLSESVIELYRHSDTPYERLWSIIIANFFPTIFNRKVCQAWVSLLSEVTHNKTCLRIQAANNARIQSNLVHVFKNFLDPIDAQRTALHFGMLIDGIWVRNGLQTARVDSEKAISEMEYAILNMLPNNKTSIEMHHEARQKITSIANIALGSKAYKEKSMLN
jgi:TetR/AcrR family transcriptional repressor of bet genes|tara:strand:- start:261 stop:944 length:684 start_codon:yes stop_codon:yes gene_type:complete